ncbi:phytoene synthase [Luminiphilus syltensis NOR5-1B]|uniref:Phytoene synthase n=2 Tax=Luminiphilus TaxID=1341118 RepID=B8KT17_9GAMM|nr:phytoene synthase [Luminiphilus syltensis NOR5-1B]
MLCCGSRSFYLASFLLPAPLRTSACCLYAFCRAADDAVDEGDEPLAALATLMRRLDAVYAGEPEDHSVDRALALIVVQHRLPRELLDALLEGFSWDASGRRYQTLSEVLDYSARVAGAVGILMSLLMGVRSPNALARAADLGAAMQLTNIARDVGEDARAGRLYLPLDWLREAGIDGEAFLARPEKNSAIASVTRRLVEEANTLYERADSGIAELPRNCRRGIYAARLLYAEIGNRLGELEFDSVSQRAIVGKSNKAALLLKTHAANTLSTRYLSAPLLPESAFLIEAVSAVDAESTGADNKHLKAFASSFYHRVLWMLDLFEAQDQRRGKTSSP